MTSLISIPGYKITELIHRGRRGTIFRARSELDDQPVIIKTPTEEYPSLDTICRFEHEKDILQKVMYAIDQRYIDFIKYNNHFAIILRDEGEVSLSEFRAKTPLSIKQFLEIGIQLTEILGKIHEKSVIHKDVKPDNILIHPETKKVKLIDFSIAEQLPRRIQEIQNLNLIEGSLSYMSPEQTGRMNCVVDYRTDFYSLGITFYNMLTGTLPFIAVDSMELIHTHIAKTAILPEQIVSTIPKVISNIVMKLMAKTPEDRYQSEYGLKVDLEKCLFTLEAEGTIPQFSIAQKDISPIFQISQKLYGREDDLKILTNAFDLICSGRTEILLVTGYSGIGKSSLVHEVYKSIAAKHGYFISGKYDQYERETPYSALVQAFRQLVQEILSENDDQINLWKEKLLKALGANGQVIIDIIPEVELIIGEQPSMTKVSPIEAQSRFNLVFINFVSAFAGPENPLTIFLDDMQWADQSSLKLLELLLTEPRIGYLLIIGAYRDNEVDKAHPLFLFLSELVKNDVFPKYIVLTPLTVANISQLIADTLNVPLEDVFSLAELCHSKTQGNPFFLKQFLNVLYADGLIVFDFIKGKWSWEFSRITKSKITDNVVDFMINQIRKLSASTQILLQLAASIGNVFDLNTLALVHDMDPQKAAESLWLALKKGFIIPLDPLYKFTQNIDRLNVTYAFSHDKIRQAVYSTIKPEDRASIHLKIANILFQNTPPEERKDILFELVSHYNSALNIILDPEEKIKIADLNLSAGRKAKSSNAYDSALIYLNTGLNLLDSDSWKNQYQLTLNLKNEKAEVSYLNNDYFKMDEAIEEVIQHAITVLDKVRVQEIKILSEITNNNLVNAIATGREFLKEFGVTLPKQMNNFTAFWYMLKTKFELADKSDEEILNIPPLTDPFLLSTLQILAVLAPPAYRSFPQLLPVIVYHGIRISIEFGNAINTPVFYICYGLLLCGVDHKIDNGYRFSKLAFRFLERVPSKSNAPRIYLIYAIAISHWKFHARDSLKWLQEAYEKALELGDLEFAAYSLFHMVNFSLILGDPLSALEQKTFEHLQKVKQLQQWPQYHYICTFHQTILNLLGKSEIPWILRGKEYDEDKILAYHEEGKDRTGIFFISLCKLILNYLFEQYPQALEMAKNAKNTLNSIIGMNLGPIFFFYDSLAYLASYPTFSFFQRIQAMKRVKANQKLMKKFSEYAPMNYLHRYYLVEAELARVHQKTDQALFFFDKAILHAQKNGYLNDAAIASELAAKFHLSKENRKIAKMYLIDALNFYLKWGAEGKVQCIEKRYVELLGKNFMRIEKGIKQFQDVITTTTETLDYITLMKTLHIISSEIDLPKLITKLLYFVVENTGAQRGVLIVKKDQHLYITGDLKTKGQDVNVINSILLENIHNLPQSLIQFVYRIKKPVILSDAANEGHFEQDPYIIEQHAKSIICLPIMYQGKLYAILYCENNLSTNVFTTNRAEILTFLTSQIAISIENAKLYSDLGTANVLLGQANKQLEDYSMNLEQKVKERMLEVVEKNKQLEIALIRLKDMQKQVIQQEKLVAWGLFSKGIAHEILNPLTFINNFASLTVNLVEDLSQLISKLNVNSVSSEINIDLKILNDNIQNIQENGLRIANIINSIQEHAKHGAEESESHDLNSLIREFLDLIQFDFLHRQPPLTLNIETHFDPSIGQVSLFTQGFGRALFNLIDNACFSMSEKQKKFKGEGTYKPTLLISSYKNDQAIEISIKDNGMGMSKEAQEKLCTPFYTTKPAGSGHPGLGLSMTYDIITYEHGGKLLIKSTEGEGTEIIIQLPPGQLDDKDLTPIPSLIDF